MAPTLVQRKLLTLAALAATVILCAPCARAADDVEFFEKKIRPLLSEHCYKCHSAEAKSLKGGLRLDHAAGVLKGGETGPAVVPGDAEKSRLIRAVRYTDSKLQMPPDGKLSDAQIADLEAWVKAGAADPRKDEPALKQQAAKAEGGIDLEKGRKWWAFQPVKDRPAPDVKRADWARKPLDRFILAKLEEKGLAPAAPADKRTLIRRAYYDLIGLPPTVGEVERFVNDASPDAFAKVVDDLLSRPQYGERWGRHWLDVVRYTDSFDGRILGNEFDAAFAWRYRDWVVKAFNTDLPYDQFVKQQIAGDLLPGPKPGAMNKDGVVATGVYFIGEWGGGDADKEKLITDIVDDQVDLTGRAFLGMTIACARCHDHKFDPISTEDYYGLAGIFHSSHVLSDPGPKGGSPSNVRVPLADPAEMEKRKSDEVRVAQLAKDLDAALDEQFASLAQQMIPQADAYLAAAWEYQGLPASARPSVLSFAQARNLHGYALGQWINYLGAPALKLFPLPKKDIRPGVSAWRNADEADTPVVLANANGQPVELIASLVVPANSVTMHPSPSAGVAVSWKSPVAGRVRVSGKVADAHAACGDGITWSLTRSTSSGAPAGELASGTIANGGQQSLAEGTGGKDLESVDVAAGDMIQLAILPKAEHSCDTTQVDLEIAEVGGRVWNLARDVTPNLTQSNPHPDSHGNPGVWYFHDLAGQAQAAFAAGSSMTKFVAAVASAPAGAGDAGTSVRAAAGEVRKSLEAVAADVQRMRAEGKDPAALPSPDAAFYQQLTAPRGRFWAGARDEDANLPTAERPRISAMRTEISGLKQSLAEAVPLAHGMQEGGTKGMFPGIQDVPVHIRGSYTRLGKVVPRRFPQVIAGENQSPIKQGSGRKELAEWIANVSNPLTARVMVNRIWQGHFGEGIVRSANNLLTLGTPPTHPELLDHLAARFVQLGWSVKAMHREIMLSATYQQSSTADPETAKADPDNLLLARMNRKRLDAEGLRDSLLAVSGGLDLSPGGPAVNDLNTNRRTLYVMTIRSDRATYRNLFDAADATAIVEKRIDSTVAPQALFLLNNPFTLAQTERLAERVQRDGGPDDAAKIDWLYRTLFSRPPTPREVAIGTAAVAGAEHELAWGAYCQVLLCTNEFMYVD